MIHPLHTPEFLRAMEAFHPIRDVRRRTGRTTILALQAIASAMESPGRYFALRDHHNSLRSDRELLERTRELVRRMGLDHFVFNRSLNSVRFG